MLEVVDAHVTLGGSEILRGAQLRAAPGRLVAVVGPNGAGKSTLIRVAAGLQKLTGGHAAWDGKDVRRLSPRKLARMRAFVPQRPSVPPGIRVRDAVELGRSPHLGPLSRATQADHDAVDQALVRTNTLAFADRSLTTLSGGELQRVQIAIGLAQGAPALLADEPTSSLDLGAASAIAQLLRRLATEDDLTVVLVVHDLALAAAVADDVVVLAHGRTVASGPPSEVLTPERLASVWHVPATIEHGDDGSTALRVCWLTEPSSPSQSGSMGDDGATI